MNRIKYILLIAVFISEEILGMISCYHFPFELELAISSYQKYELSNKEKNLFHKKVIKIESQLKKISKIYHLFIVKSYFYKKILDFDIQIQGIDIIKKKDISRLEKKYYQYNNYYNDFSNWLIEVIISDLKKLSKLSERFRNNPRTIRKVNRQTKHLIPWYNHFILSDVERINYFSKKIIESLLDQIIIYLNVFLSFSSKDLVKETEKEGDGDKIIEVEEVPYCNYEQKSQKEESLDNIDFNENTPEKRKKSALRLMEEISV